MSTPSLEKGLASVTVPVRSDDGRSPGGLDDFVRARRRLFTIAYRIAGNVHEAEDVLQEVWLRWQRLDQATVANAEAFLVTVTGRLALNLVQSARRRHESSVAAWPHEEMADHDADPQTHVERGERIGQAIELLLERLPPAERAAYVLREGFEYPYQRISQILQIGGANARQLVKRARAHVAAGRRHSVSPAARSRLRRAFAVASHSGDLTGLEALLAADLKRVS
jgi:RNA polymerase sigma factor (sigma-70 family)